MPVISIISTCSNILQQWGLSPPGRGLLQLSGSLSYALKGLNVLHSIGKIPGTPEMCPVKTIVVGLSGVMWRCHNSASDDLH